MIHRFRRRLVNPHVVFGVWQVDSMGPTLAEGRPKKIVQTKLNKGDISTIVKNKLMKMNYIHSKIEFCISIVLAVMVLLVTAVPTTFAAGPVENPTADAVGPPPVFVPVMLDGVLYQPDEFNRINQALYSKGVNLVSTVDPENGNLIAFTSYEEYEKYAEEHGLPSIKRLMESAQKAGPATIVPLLPNEKAGDSRAKSAPSGMVEFWDYTYYGGSGMCVGYGVINILANIGWDERISSSDVGSGAGAALFDRTGCDWGGNVFVYYTDKPNLGTYGWSNRALSLSVGSY